jgi:2-C-methyl-D-erythritol 4-phosphate cytidylyltransferase
MKFAVILTCAGKGQRLKTKEDKAFVNLKNRPLFSYSYETFSSLRYISQIIVVARKQYFPVIKHYTKDNCLIVPGGARRQDSIYQGLQEVSNKIDYIFIHDGARPFIETHHIDKLKQQVPRHQAVSLAIPITSALKKVQQGYITNTIDRQDLYLIQTPQLFRRELIIDAYKNHRETKVYDDTQFMEMLNQKVKIVPGSVFNFKITYPPDLDMAEAIVNGLRSIDSDEQ